MNLQKEDLGKVSITVNGIYDDTKEYDRLCLVVSNDNIPYISRKLTPAGTSLSNEEYWLKLSFGGVSLKYIIEEDDAVTISSDKIFIKNSKGYTNIVSDLGWMSFYLEYVINAINKIYPSLKNLETLYNNLSDRVGLLDTIEAPHWVRPQDPEPIPIPQELEVTIEENNLSLLGENAIVASDILSLDYISIIVNENVLIF